MNRQDEELWMKKMKEVLKDYSEPPAPDGWSKLERNMKPQEVKRLYPYTWWVAAAVLLLALSGVSLFFMQTQTADDIRQASEPVIAVVPDVIPETKEPESFISPSVPVKKDIVALQRSHLSVDETTGGEIAGQDRENIEKTEEANIILPNKTETDDVTEPVAEQQPEQKSDERKRVKPSGKDKLHLPVVSGKRSSTKGKWSLSASASNVPSTSSGESMDYLVIANVTDGLSSEMLSVDKNELVFEGGLPYFKQSVQVSEVKHKQPVSFGLSVRRNLANGFSVESGVVYTMLSSEGKSNDNETFDQKLHYIGIPVRGNWDFVEKKRFTAYLIAGGMIEKCVYGKIGSERHTVKPLQFSLSGGVGAQVNISDKVGVYIEPGVAYFFDDGSDVETIRKENPFNFNLQAGIRFTY